MKEPIHVNSEAFELAVLKSPLPVLVDFWAPWCRPCLQVAPEIAALAKEKTGHLVVAKVNTEQLHGLAQSHRISAIPTMVLFRAGVEVDRESGAMPRPEIIQRFGL